MPTLTRACGHAEAFTPSDLHDQRTLDQMQIRFERSLCSQCSKGASDFLSQPPAPNFGQPRPRT